MSVKCIKWYSYSHSKNKHVLLEDSPPPSNLKSKFFTEHLDKFVRSVAEQPELILIYNLGEYDDIAQAEEVGRALAYELAGKGVKKPVCYMFYSRKNVLWHWYPGVLLPVKFFYNLKFQTLSREERCEFFPTFKSVVEREAQKFNLKVSFSEDRKDENDDEDCEQKEEEQKSDENQVDESDREQLDENEKYWSEKYADYWHLSFTVEPIDYTSDMDDISGVDHYPSDSDDDNDNQEEDEDSENEQPASKKAKTK